MTLSGETLKEYYARMERHFSRPEAIAAARYVKPSYTYNRATGKLTPHTEPKEPPTNTLTEQALTRAAYLQHHDPRTAQLLTQLADTIQLIETTKEPR